MDKIDERIENLQMLIDTKWNKVIDGINEVGELSKQLTVLKLQKRLKNAETQERQI